MTAGNVIPLRPSEAERPGVNAQAGPRARAHAREEVPPRRRRMPPAAAVGAIFAGASWVHGSPPSVMSIWELHKASAAYLPRWLKWPRLVYGAFHAFMETPVLYLLVLAGDSVPKRLGLYGVVALVLWLLHVI